ncbi:MAG: 50S ribosomal protein L10, partial [Thermoplasmata archaeon]|nr:50S ribosomal protein L10 [Thermoplasmata archaeon]
MAHVAPWKEEMLKELKDLISAGPVVGIVAVDGIPGPQLQNMRRGLRKGSPFIVSKNTLIRLAIEEMDSEKSGLKDL